MNKWIILVALAALGVLIIGSWATFAAARGTESSVASVQDEDWLEDMQGYCDSNMGGMMGGGMGGAHVGLVNQVTLGRVADTLGLTYEALKGRLSQGETIAQIAKAQGVDTSAVLATILAPKKEILQVNVKYGYLSQAQADTVLEQASLWVQQAISEPLYGTGGATGTTSRPGSGGMMGGSGGMMGGSGGMMGGSGGMMGGSGGMMGW